MKAYGAGILSSFGELQVGESGKVSPSESGGAYENSSTPPTFSFLNNTVVHGCSKNSGSYEDLTRAR